MSGSGGSYLGPSTPALSCTTLQFETQLASPKQHVVAQLNVNDVLQVAFDQQGGQSNNQQVVVALWQGAVAGGIVDPNLHQLRNCMSQGEIYAARVLRTGGGQVRVRVYHI
ncbi:hypothetical protein NTD84_24360 [Pseudomonas sp. 14P_8.1_Bac3]|uniref:hypothetical protein n=1 Tax=Pseudomonas sp. 14P_8.1_Bac3 TaxID=2971621 RepID=UPI0021C57F79|nr:hypothetical protein [Pseudomonas sp. 14P_8.1_Bac3]MCU1762836.1 hypothetical protein [Pseudomonas sp. 14P_8.1_Bac3]